MKEFKREERYIVIKRKDLTLRDELVLKNWLKGGRIPTQECVVCEEGTLENKVAWAVIEAKHYWKELNEVLLRSH